MRSFLIASAITLALGGTAFAQMCGSAMQQQSDSTAQSGMGCMAMKQAERGPMADKPAKPMMGGMICPCCRNMASMERMKQSDSGDQHKLGTMPSHRLPGD